MKQILFIEGELPALNEIIGAINRNRYVGANLKKKYTNLVAWECKHQRVKPFDGKIDIQFTWNCKNKKKDKDNIMAGQKFIFDGLQLAGIIKNDGWKEIGNIDHRFTVDKNNVGVEILMEECEK